MLKKILLVFILMLCSPVFANTENTGVSPDEALIKLKEGNKRFSSNHLKHPNQNAKRRIEIEKSQHPFVIIISCSDSRVPPQIIFDQGLGDIFEIQNAGNVTDEHVMGSVEYAVIHLGVKLIVVMGHQNCGAVNAAIDGGEQTDNINSIISSIEPAVNLAKKQSGSLVDNAIKNNVQITRENIENDKNLKKYINSNGVKVISAYYHLDSGQVDFSE